MLGLLGPNGAGKPKSGHRHFFFSYYPRHGYEETHRAVQDGFNRVFIRKIV